MSERIEVGDLVMVMREHCPANAVLGKIFGVIEVWPAQRGVALQCGNCGGVFSNGEHHSRLGNKNADWIPTAWLRKIPPLSELDRTEHQEELTV